MNVEQLTHPATEEERWRTWVDKGAAGDAQRRSQLRSLLAFVCFAAAVWTMWLR